MIHKVLSTMRSFQVKSLLMGGQACILYGGAEFSRDTDLLIIADSENLHRLKSALDELKAVCIAVPPFSQDYLLKGHAVHFRCNHPDALKMRVDVMSILRGMDPFEKLWERRNTIELKKGETVEVMALPDLVQAKKTQRDKDWPMIRRLMEVDYIQDRENPSEEKVSFWLRELRTPIFLIELVKARPELAKISEGHRPLLADARLGNEVKVREGLEGEQRQETERDRIYWEPLLAELERLRHDR